MSVIINESQLKAAIAAKSFIKDGKVENVEGIKYDFRMSSKVLKSGIGRPIDINNIPEKERASIAVEPGEVVFVLTEEVLDLPDNIKADLSPKRKLSHDGIMTIGGLCIDPLYNGKLLIGLYNFSSSSFPLIPGKKLIAAVFSKLSPEEQDRFKKPENPIFDFPDDLIRLMEKYKPISIQVIMDEIKKLNCKIDLLNNEIKDREDWYKRLQEGIEHHEKAIEKLTNLLEKETNERRESQKDIDAKLSQLTERMYDNFNKYSKEAYRIAAFISVGGAFFISLIIWLIKKLIFNM